VRIVAARPEPTPRIDTAADHASALVQVRRYLRFLGAGRGAVDDLAQETMLTALRHWREASPPLPWLLATARNHLRMHWRTKGNRREIADVDRLHRMWIEQAGDDAGEAQRAALRECLALLPERSRQLIDLRYGSALPREAIAQRLGLRDEGVKSLLTRVRDALAACVRRRLDDG
jgi:RNA polymerase sigma-70 factor, ECF subfamily